MDFTGTQLCSEQVPRSLSSFECIFKTLHSKGSNLPVQNVLKYRWLSLRLDCNKYKINNYQSLF